MIKKILFSILFVTAIAIMAINFFSDNQSATVTTNPTTPVSTQSQSLDRGAPAPNFTLTDQNGETVQLSDYRGKKVILNFWATWCPPCRAEMPHMQEFHEDQDNNDVEIVAVNLTAQDNGAEAIQSFIDEFGLTFTMPMDELGNVANTYQIRTVPTTYILNTKGEIAQKIVGPMDAQIMKNQTDSIE